MSAPAWLDTILKEPRYTDICINGNQQIFIDQGQGLELLPDCAWRGEELKGWVLEQLSLAGKSWDARNPFLDASLPSGHRLHVTFPPIAQQGILVSLRRLPCFGKRQTSAEKRPTAQDRWGTSPHFNLLVEAVSRGDSILIAGATGSGKTTLANDLLGQVPASERIIALEDTPELSPEHPHFISLNSRPANADGFGEVTLRTLLRQTLRMRPDRIVLGECRGPETLDLLQALNTGHRGGMATLHANSPREALRRIELLCLLSANGTVPLTAIRELMALGLQWVVQAKRHEQGRRIEEVWRVEGREGDTILMRQMK